MSSEEERRALERIEADLVATDPTLADRFRRPFATWRLFFVLLAVTGVCALAAGILAGSAILTMAGIATVGVLVVEHLGRRARTTRG
ncbi:DUF3040 domain-containing protein [Amycolatopsis sp. NPDC051371]|uniref:DUF3040 domain-containing protein n=1 Tax=Amycolatopsis sp. NPDC051371 TaxID=3155800 RepID=UPI0034332BEE